MDFVNVFEHTGIQVNADPGVHLSCRAQLTPLSVVGSAVSLLAQA
jgi:hypothetical protein